jgi:glycosyltransferase involved in cell wall biosynthesis
VLDWLWDRPALIRMLAGRSVKTDPRLLGALTVSMLRGEQGNQRKEIEKLLAWLRTEPAFDLAVLPNALLISLARPLSRALGCPVLCTLQGEDLFLEGLEEPGRTEALSLIRQQVRDVAGFVAVSDYCAESMAGYLAIARDRITTVPLGIALDGYDRPRPERDGPFRLGYFARIDPAKGLDRLCEVYRLLRQEMGLPAARLVAAGYLGDSHRGYLEACRERMRAWGLESEFDYVGELDRPQKIAFLSSLDVLSVPTVYAEPKGLFVLEAMACGVPVVQPRWGAFPEILERTGGGLVVDNDPAALARGIATLWRDPAAARELGRRGAHGVRQHYGAEAMAERALQVYGDAVAGPRRLQTAAAGARAVVPG